MPTAAVVAVGVLCAATLSTTILGYVVPDDVTTGRREASAFLAALLMYSVFYGAFFAPSLLSGNYIAPSDSLDFGVAAYLASPALWTEGMWSGYPIAADPQALTWYPPLHLFRALGADWNIFLISAYVLTSASTFLFVRRLTRSTLAGAFSGFVCGFSGLLVGYITNFNQIHAFAWVPLALYGLQLIREDARHAGAALTAMAVALMWLAGHPQIPVYSMYMAAAVIGGGLLVDRVSAAVALTRLRWAGLALALGLMLAAVALLPMIELGRFSPRAASQWELYISSALPPRELFGLLAPFAFGGFWDASGGIPYIGDTGDSGYVGLLPLALALALVVVHSRRRCEARLWVCLTAIEILLCLGAATPLGTLFYYAPGYASFQAPLRHLFLVTLCLAVSSGLAVAAVIEQREHRGIVAGAVLALMLLGAIAFAAFAWQTPAAHALIDTNASYVAWAIAWPLGLACVLVAFLVAARHLPNSRGGSIAFAGLLVAFQVGDLTMLHYRMPGRRFEYADIRRAEAVPHPKMVALRAELERTDQRVLATDGSRNQFLLPNLTRAWRIPAASGSGSLAIQRYLEVMRMDTSGAVSRDALSATGRGVDLFGIRYALVRQDSELAGDLQHERDHWQPVENLHYYEDDPDTYYTLFTNMQALPRAWCVSHAVRVSASQALSTIHIGRFPGGAAFDPLQSALLESDSVPDWKEGAVTGTAATVPVHNRDGGYLVRSTAPCLLVVGDVYYPWWRASIDGTPADVGRVNYTMVGVVVPAGLHVVRLAITPLSVWIGGSLSGIGILLWSALVIPVCPWFRRYSPI
jgi:hypothetical protein